MPIELIQASAAACAVLFIAGCTTTGVNAQASTVDRMGEATRQTLAAQIIDPDPTYEYADPTTSGQHAAMAVERYRTDKVKQPERTTTSRSNGASGAGLSSGTGN